MKTIIKKTITLSFIFILSVLSVVSCAQEKKTTLELLQGKLWIGQTPNGNNSKNGIRYKDKKEYYYYNNDLFGSNYFYLSDNIEKYFDKSKIGKNNTGKYIITENTVNPDDFGVIEIVEISEDRLEIRNIKQEHTIVFKSKKE